MTDEIGAVLQEIAQLLRQRVEQTADMAKRSEERLAGIRRHQGSMPDLSAMQAKYEAEAASRHEETARLRAEDVDFRERLLRAIEDQNALLRTLVDRLAPTR